MKKKGWWNIHYKFLLLFLQEYAENIYTVDGAVKEIKDKATKQRLQFLPYKLQVKEPSPESYKHGKYYLLKYDTYATIIIVYVLLFFLVVIALNLEKVMTFLQTNFPKKYVWYALTFF